jgi:hypothetical protein
MEFQHPPVKVSEMDHFSSGGTSFYCTAARKGEPLKPQLGPLFTAIRSPITRMTCTCLGSSADHAPGIRGTEI